MKTVKLSYLEDGVWYMVPFRVRSEPLRVSAASKIAIGYRLRGYLARLVRNGKLYTVVTYKPRRWAPRRCDLVVRRG